MDSYCGNTVDMDDSNLDSMKLRLTYSSKYRSNMDCKMRIKTRSGQRLSFKFLDMDIAKIFTCDDYLEIRDGSSSSSSDTKCNSDEFSCDNGRCIDQSLYCDSYDNCGDDSDDCYMDTNWWVWMVIGIVVFIIFCAIVITVRHLLLLLQEASRGTVLKFLQGSNGSIGTAVNFM
ncbi:vitellogenin receptor-like [Haliotis rubra]|uniref:vitellogenin receptor-like n=1 Tax=Haliotis rubra TaxID=36100 RepID=UPI001EE57599|nr:vitellogenin receptor-like [Haliotis rubra]